MLPRLRASPVVSLRTCERQTDPCAQRESALFSCHREALLKMKLIATPPAIAAGVEEASKDAVARCFVSIKS